MSKGPLGTITDLLRVVALLMLIGLMFVLYRVLDSPPDMAVAPRGFPGAHVLDAGVEAPVTYASALSHVQPSAPPVIDGRIAGIYTRRESECHASYIHTQGLCVHRAVDSDPRGAVCIDAFRRGVAPPSVAVVGESVLWPTTIQYERRDMIRGSYNVEQGRTAQTQTSHGRNNASTSADEELRRLQRERQQQTAQELAIRDQRRSAATQEAQASRAARDQRWRQIQVNP